jgi:hypothetical protein
MPRWSTKHKLQRNKFSRQKWANKPLSKIIEEEIYGFFDYKKKNGSGSASNIRNYCILGSMTLKYCQKRIRMKGLVNVWLSETLERPKLGDARERGTVLDALEDCVDRVFGASIGARGQYCPKALASIVLIPSFCVLLTPTV